MNVFPAPPGRPRWRMYVVAGLVVWVLISLGGLAVFVASINSDFDIEEALNEKYDASITFERCRRQQELTVDGRRQRVPGGGRDRQPRRRTSGLHAEGRHPTALGGRVDREERVGRMPMTQVWVQDGDGWLCLAGHAGPRFAG